MSTIGNNPDFAIVDHDNYTTVDKSFVYYLPLILTVTETWHISKTIRLLSTRNRPK